MNPPTYVETADEIERRRKAFTYHAPNDSQVPRFERLRSEACKLAQLINENCPPSRERSLAMTSLEETVMWANAAIARNE